METITAIEEVQDRAAGDQGWSKQDGFLITTTEQEIWLGIDNGYSCCESWGYLISEDDTPVFRASCSVAAQLTRHRSPTSGCPRYSTQQWVSKCCTH